MPLDVRLIEKTHAFGGKDYLCRNWWGVFEKA